MQKKLGTDFYETQRRQQKKSLVVFIILTLFYFLAIGLISLSFIFIFGLFLTEKGVFSTGFLAKFLPINLALSFIIAFFHYYDAKKFGASFIRQRLMAEKPNLSDRYHQRLVNVLEEMRLASGLPRVHPYIIPCLAVNSMALIDPDRTPSVIVTEGLLAEFTRDELEAVIAHELAHLTRGDTYYLTLVCSLANFFERLRQSLEPEDYNQNYALESSQRWLGSSLIYFMATLSTTIMHLLSTLISRQREILADAVAVEISRNPRALARAIYKAHIKNSFVGDFNLTYSPLFIVSPSSRGEREGFLSRLLSSHPPLMTRIRLLSEMANIRPTAIMEEVWQIQKNREKARIIISAHEPATAETATSPTTIPEVIKAEAIWLIRDARGKWQGPYTIEQLFALRFFSPLIRVKNLQEKVEAQAREFPQIRQALRRRGRSQAINPARHNRCPRCLIPLTESFYEGVPLKLCRRCNGKLVDTATMERIIIRREYGFSPDLIKKAAEFKQKYMLSPLQIKKINSDKGQDIFCPNCGSKMLSRPYSYSYFIPVDKCLACHKIWFDSDELEILQILIENR